MAIVACEAESLCLPLQSQRKHHDTQRGNATAQELQKTFCYWTGGVPASEKADIDTEFLPELKLKNCFTPTAKKLPTCQQQHQVKVQKEEYVSIFLFA